MCPAAATPGSAGRSNSVREDALLPAITEFLSEYVLGPHRRDVLAAHLDPGQAAHAARKAKEKAQLHTRLRRIDKAQDGLIHELETPADPHDKATAALRQRIRARFAELETERTDLQTQLQNLDSDPAQAEDPTLLDELPTLAGRLDQAPPALLAALLQACDIQLLYRRELHQVTIWATITSTTPTTLREPSWTAANPPPVQTQHSPL